MSSDAVPNAILICSTGPLAGSRFEVGAESTIGSDSKGQLVVVQGTGVFATRYARVFAAEGRHHLEPLGTAAEVSVDGVAITSRVPLEKRHAIGVRNIAEFVYSKSAAPVAPPSPHSPHSPPSPAVDAKGTMMAKGGFDALPDLVGRPTPPSPPSPASPPSPPSPTVDAKGTMMAKGGFDAMPELLKPPSPAAKSAVPPPPEPEPPVTPQQRGRYTPFGDQAAVTPPVAPPPPSPPPSPPSPVSPPSSPSLDDDDGATVAMPAPVVLSGLQLVVTLEGQGRVEYDLKIGDNIVGRGKDADVRIPDPRKWLSRQHVNVRVSRDKVELIDLGGANGTYVSGKKITTAIIAPGSSFDLGPSMAFTVKKK